jgi:hypothetical protein
MRKKNLKIEAQDLSFPPAEQEQGIGKYLYFMYIYLIILTMRPLRRGFFHGFFKKKL